MLPSDTTKRNPSFRPFASSTAPAFLSQFKDSSKTSAPTSSSSLHNKPVTSFAIPKESLDDFDIFSENIPSASAPNTFASTAINTPFTSDDNYSVERQTTTPGGRVVKLLSPSRNFLQRESASNSTLQPKKRVEFSTTAPVSPSQLDPYYQNEITAGRIPTEKNWITVFGFPPSKLSFVLKHFASYGEIVDRKTGNGNWVHLLYRDSFAAKKALSKSGKKFGSDLMLGVVECLDRAVVTDESESTKKRKFTETNPIIQTKSSNQWVESENGVKKRALNPVGVSPTSAVPTNIFANDGSNKPQPQRGFWNKLVDMVFKF